MNQTSSSTQGSHFKLAFITFLVLGFTGLGILVWLSTVDSNLMPQQTKLSEAGDWLMKSGIGAVVGMLVDRRVR